METVMAQYYLHQRRSTALIRDLEGAEFNSIEEARQEAITAARELLSEMALTGVLDLTARFEIVGEDGSSTVVPFLEAVSVRMDHEET
jgi:hypothetical protein